MPRAKPAPRLPFCLLAPVFLLAVPGRSPADAVQDIVITEIMYNPSSDDRREDFIELYNQGTVPYGLAGWRFEDGVSFTFGNVTLPAKQYLVVCADQDRIRQLYGITNTTGNWDAASTLDNGGERIRLLDKDGVEIEDITYDDRNPWPILADGYGHSLEKRNPAGDNDDPANWTASGAGTGWSKVTVTGLATSSALYVYLSAAGTAYVDDFKIFPVGSPGDNRVKNPGFEGVLGPWTANGNHSGSAPSTQEAHSGAYSLKLTATGAGNGSGTAVVQADLGLVNDNQYTLEFWALVPVDGLRIICRLSGTGGIPEPIYTEAGGGGATPGRTNSANASDIPPFVYPAYHLPATPTSADNVVIQAVVKDDVSLAEVRARWDAGAGEKTALLFDDGAHQDGVAADGVYGAPIGSFPVGTIVRYHVTATDGLGQVGRLPFSGNPTPSLGFYIQPGGINPGFIARSNSGLTSDKPPVYHLLLSAAALAQLAANPDTYVRGTFIFNGEVFENVRIRHRGQSSLNTPKQHWKVDFNKDHRFLTPFDDHGEVDNINLQSSYGDKSFLREWLSYKAWMDAGQPSLEMWHVRMYLNQAYRGLYVHLENPDGDWMDRTGLDPEGWLWKSYSQAKGGTGGFEPEEMGSDASRANEELGEFMNNMNTLSGGALEDYIQDNMDVQSFTDFLAVTQLIHNCDHPAKNYLVYADEDLPAGTWTYLPWDMDLTHGRNYECAGGGVYNDTIRFDMFGDPQLMFGTAQRPKCDGPWNGVINAFLARATTYREPFYARTADLLKQHYSPAVLNPLIDDMSGPLLAEMEMDWNKNPPQYGSRATAQFHVDKLKGFVQSRHDYLQNALNKFTAPDVSDLECTRSGNDVDLVWKNNDPRYTEIRVYRNQFLLLSLAGSATSAKLALDLTQDVNTFKVASVFNSGERAGESCTIVVSAEGYAVVIDEDFTPPASSSALAVNCAAQQVDGALQLTPAAPAQAGVGFFRTQFAADDFIAEFDVEFDDPSSPNGGDGLVFVMARAGDPALCGGAGAALGFWQGDAGGVVFDGYGVQLDTWQNAGEPSHNWAGFIDTDRQASGAFAGVNVPEEFTGNGVFHVKVTGQAGTFKLSIGNAGLGMALREVSTYTAPSFVPGPVHFGFTAGTGDAFARHSVDNFILRVKSETPPPVAAAFHADVPSGEAPLTVTFINDSTGADGFRWDFGDGTGSFEVSPQHLYQAPGAYNVKLTAVGPGGTDVEEKPAYIEATLIVEADFTADKTIGPVPMTVRFSDRSRKNVPVTYLWDFGDGATSTLANTIHAYRQPGQYDVTLRVTAQDGPASTLTRPAYIQVDDTLAADFTADPLTGSSPLSVSFHDTSTGRTIQSWQWDFGDGETAAVQEPVHVYRSPGTYTVRLVISGFQAVSTKEKVALITVLSSGGTFRRGDGNSDGAVDISDAVRILGFLFLGEPLGRCADAFDANDDGAMDISDPIRVLGFLFLGDDPLPPPSAEAGTDPTPDALPDCSS